MADRPCLTCWTQYGGNCEGRCRGWREYGCDKLPPPGTPTAPHYYNHGSDRDNWNHAEMFPFDTPPWIAWWESGRTK